MGGGQRFSTYLITLSVISHVGSSTVPDSSVAFEIFNVTRDVAHTMDKYWSARFNPGPGGKTCRGVTGNHKINYNCFAYISGVRNQTHSQGLVQVCLP